VKEAATKGSDTRLKLTCGKPKDNGWKTAAARRGAPPKVDPIVPTRFDSLLVSLHLQESTASSHPVMRHWIKMHYRTCFVPEKVLDQLGVSSENI
jgi:hypothetical protein